MGDAGGGLNNPLLSAAGGGGGERHSLDLEAKLKGLTSAEAAAQLAKFGKNEIPEEVTPASKSFASVASLHTPTELAHCAWRSAHGTKAHTSSFATATDRAPLPACPPHQI